LFLIAKQVLEYFFANNTSAVEINIYKRGTITY
jgi:hypothetical protein